MVQWEERKLENFCSVLECSYCPHSYMLYLNDYLLVVVALSRMGYHNYVLILSNTPNLILCEILILM